MIGIPLATATARALQAPTTVHDTLRAPLDSVVVESPLPGGVAAVVRFLLNTVPSWVQIGGIFVAALVAVLVVALLVRRRREIVAWVTVRNRAAKAALAVVAVVLLAGIAGAGTATWNYTQHSNDFCTGCHVMNPAFQRFAGLESGHDDLSCHDCHQQPLSASIRQLYLWVAERPEAIGEHAKLDNQVCERCHATADTARWQRIATTAGHRVHLESDSASLENLQCVTCHGLEVHSFRPVAETCGQSGCHGTADTEIVLGRMARQTMLHCATCHEFTAEVPALATRDSARTTLVPGTPQCMSCHEMRAVLADFDVSREPHDGKCGLCHNPHTQATPAEAVASCATCHVDWRDEPFHVGASHRRVGERCLTCHQPHQAKVDASACQACHERVRTSGGLRPPLPFDTSAALRRSDTATAAIQPAAPTLPRASPAAHAVPRHAAPPPVRHGGPFVPDPGDDAMVFAPVRQVSHGAAVVVPAPPQAVADTFPHARHATIACLVCHQTGTGQGRLTFESPRGCAICHHQAPRQARCESCHRPADYGQPRDAMVTVTVPGHPPAPRRVEFVHAAHAERPCLECHTTPVTLALAPAKAQCADCHAEHHAAGQSCASCHPVAEPGRGHPTPESAHQRCDACHAGATIELLTPTRTFCITCHAPAGANHYEPRECTVCHLLAEPAAYRPQLITARPR